MDALEMMNDEHALIRHMLTCFENELGLFRRNEQPDYDVLESSIDYCQLYLNDWHHPVEEALFELLQRRAPDQAQSCAELASGHAALGRDARELARAFGAVRQDIPFRRDDLAKRGVQLVTAYRRHLVWEEAHFYPAVRQVLTSEDWQSLGTQFAGQSGPFARHSGDRRNLPVMKVVNGHLCPVDRAGLAG